MSLNDHVAALITARTRTDLQYCAEHFARYGEAGRTEVVALLDSPDSRIATRALHVVQAAKWIDAGTLKTIYVKALKARPEPSLRMTALCLLLEHAANGMREANVLLELYADQGTTQAAEIAQAMALCQLPQAPLGEG